MSVQTSFIYRWKTIANFREPVKFGEPNVYKNLHLNADVTLHISSINVATNSKPNKNIYSLNDKYFSHDM